MSGSRTERAFTLIELLVVMIIIAILTAIAIPTFLSQKRNADTTKAKQNLKMMVDTITTCSLTNTNSATRGEVDCTDPAVLSDQDKAFKNLGTIHKVVADDIDEVVADIETKPGLYGIWQPGDANDTETYVVGYGRKWNDQIVVFLEGHGQDGTLAKLCFPEGVQPCPPSGKWG